MYKIQGWVEQGNTRITTSGLNSSNVAQGSFPGSLVSVYAHGSSPATLAAIFSDDNTVPTPLANPFTSNADGTFGFYAATGRYDLVFSGGALVTPYTISDVTNGAGGGVGDVVGPVGATHFDFAQFSGVTGKIIMDSGFSPQSFDRPLGPFTAGHAIVVDSSSGNGQVFTRDGGTGLASFVSGPGSATDGNVAVFNGGSGKQVRDGGSFTAWTTVINDPGISLANWTQASGSWSVVSSAFQVNTGATTTRFLNWTPRIAQSALIFEADVNMSSAGGFGADNRIGFNLNAQSTGAGGMLAVLRSTGALTPASTGTIYTEQPQGATAGAAGLTFLFNLNQYYRLRVVAIGSVMDIYVDGVYKYTLFRNPAPAGTGVEQAYVFLYAYNCIANFKNIKMYAVTLP
jgi:hypothetical protein